MTATDRRRRRRSRKATVGRFERRAAGQHAGRGDAQRALVANGCGWRGRPLGPPDNPPFLPTTPPLRIAEGRSYVFPCRFGFCPVQRFATFTPLNIEIRDEGT